MNQADKQYCQSCGMPLRFDMEEYMGTNSDHSRSHEYCYYCLKDGDYTVDIP
ncbi:transcriptional regulator, partial [Dysgonomonas sp. 521]|uniref:zinc ribbon domain-containing protein n=1 Tax=Dysgonomonas sp. 521 TaxID=2302932 RepID=UPI001C87F9AC